MMTTQKSKIQEAIDLIDAAPAPDGRGYVYHADETGEWWRVTADELAELADLLHHDDEDIRRDAYSHWCPGTGELIGDDAAAREAGLID